MKQLEKRELLEPQGLEERIDTLLRMVEEGESFEIVDQGRVIALLTPPRSREHPDEQDYDDIMWEPTEFSPSREQELKDLWASIDALAAQISEHSPRQIDAVEIVREGRRDL